MKWNISVENLISDLIYRIGMPDFDWRLWELEVEKILNILYLWKPEKGKAIPKRNELIEFFLL